MIQFRFNGKKIIEVLNYLLHKNNGMLNYTKIIKLLYIADRDCLIETGSSISSDSYYAMDQGPVLSKTYDLIKGSFSDTHIQTIWDTLFVRTGYDLELINVDSRYSLEELSEHEINVLNKIDTKYKDFSWNEMVDVVHDQKQFPEWVDPHGTSIPIPIEKILSAAGWDSEEIKAWEMELANIYDDVDFFSVPSQDVN
jgi:uncharacterized phage-associated protein